MIAELNKLKLVLILVSLAVCVVVAVTLGWMFGGGLFLVAFFFLGGHDLLWDLVWHRFQNRVDENVDRSIRDDAAKGSRDNPTIR